MPNRRGMSRRGDLGESAHIIVNGKRIACTVTDRSRLGARIEGYGGIHLPQEFLIQIDLAARPCWLVWYTADRAGISFSAITRNGGFDGPSHHPAG